MQIAKRVKGRAPSGEGPHALKKVWVVGHLDYAQTGPKVVQSMSVRRANSVQSLTRAASGCWVKCGLHDAGRLPSLGQFRAIGIRLSKRYRFLVVAFIPENVETRNPADLPVCLDV